MLRRPNSGDSEADLLRDQEQFLASGKPPAVHVVRRPDKRRGESGQVGEEQEAQKDHKDVVSIPDLPDEIPALTPAPSKKSRFRAERVRFEGDDPEAQLDRHDTHVTAVLSRIIERDTSTVPVSLPAFSGSAFPKAFHRSDVGDQEALGPAPAGRKSIFAQKIAAQRARGGADDGHSKLGYRGSDFGRAVSMETAPPPSEGHVMMGTSKLLSGLGLSRLDGTLEAKRIHQENRARLQGMSQSEILQEQQRLLAQLDPQLVAFVRSHKAQGAPVSAAIAPGTENEGHEDRSPPVSGSIKGPQPLELEMEVEETKSLPQPPITEQELPIKPQKEWLHMDKLEPEKLEWTRDLPAPRKRGTREAMQARFDFRGVLIPPTQDLPTHLGLHHHGDEPELAGYSLQELFHLSRSQVTQQRSLALNTLANILAKAHAGSLASSVKGSVVSTLLDAGLLFLLRFSLDDSVEGVMAAAAHALRALLVPPGDEECLDSTFSHFHGMVTFPLLPSAQEEEEDEEDEGLEDVMRETAQEKEERKPDHDVAREDVVKGLLRMKLLPRLRYILEVVRPSPHVVLDLLAVLLRIARHSSASATQILDCPRLMETVMSEFLPCSWATPASPAPERLHGLPVAGAMKLLRVLATSGRHACARLLHTLGAQERLSRLLALEPQELQLDPSEALRLSTEALRLWAVAAGYGQGCHLYRDLYPLLLKALQSLPREWPPADSLRPLELQRAQALLTLLTHVTQTAGCHQELLQASLASPQGTECPPPPVEWSHVTGLQSPLLASLRGCVRGLGVPSQRASSLSLLPPHLIYLGAFYSQLRAQSSFRPVECLQELEALTSEVLLPLLSDQATLSMIGSLRSRSVICNPHSCCPGPETIPSLPRPRCCWGETVLNLTRPGSPFPLLTALCYLLETLASVHRGIAHKFSPLLLSDDLSGYLRACCQATPFLPSSSAWLLRQEHHLLYLLLKLARRLVPVSPEVAKQASLYHQVAVVMLPWLLPGSEHLAHDLLSTVMFNLDLIPEGRCGGAEAADLSELKLQESSSPTHPPLGPLLRDACAQLPSLRACYLTHLAYLEPAVLRSRHAHLGHTPRVNSRLLPEALGPALPSDWPFLPLVCLHERAGAQAESLPPGSAESAVHCLQWLLILDNWREAGLRVVLPAARLARLSCLFHCSSDLFLERPVQRLGWALLRGLCRPSQLATLDLGVPLPGLASFHDLYGALLAQFEAVSFGDPLFGCFLLLPLQRRFDAALRLAVFGEHAGLLRSLGVTLQQLPIPLENFTSPPEDSRPLLRLYFRSLVTGALRHSWCPVLYAVALAHLNAFIFSQEAVSQEVDAARQGMLRKTYYLTDEVLKGHLLLFKAPLQQSELGFETYDSLPSIRARRLENVVGARADGDRVKD